MSYPKKYTLIVLFIVMTIHVSLLAKADTLKDDNLCFHKEIQLLEQIEQCEQQLGILKETKNTPLIYYDIVIRLIYLYTRKGNFSRANELINLSGLETIVNQLEPETRFLYFRRKGILHYRQGLYPEALSAFHQGQSVAQTLKDDIPLGRTYADLGTAHLAMMAFDKALDAYRKSLVLRERSGDQNGIAITMNNIGTVYRKMHDWHQAEHYYQKAIDIHNSTSNTPRLAHTQENLGLIYLDTEQYFKAIEVFNASLNAYRQSSDKHGLLRLQILLARAYIDSGNYVQAEKYILIAKSTEFEMGESDQSLLLQLQAGRLQSVKGENTNAELTLKLALKQAIENQNEALEIAFLHELVSNAERGALWLDAFNYQKQFSQAQIKTNERAFDQSLATSRALFEYEQQQKTIQLRNQQKKIGELELKAKQTQLIIMSGAALIIIFGLTALIFLFWRHKVKTAAELEAQISYHRDRVVQFGTNYTSLKNVFMHFKEPLIAFNNKRELIFVNRECEKCLDLQQEIESDLTLDNILPKSNKEFWQEWLSHGEIENRPIKKMEFSLEGKLITHDVILSTVHADESILIIVMCDLSSPALPIAFNSLLPKPRFSHLLVDLMRASLEQWEVSTNSNRIELAEQSGIWKVSIDDGRLRTRSMDRYLSLKSLPKKPRWREVVRTAHFVLAECKLQEEKQQALEQKLDEVMQFLRAEALV